MENRDKLDLIAKELLERETLSAAELEELMTKGAISEKDKQNDDMDDTGKPAPIPVDVVIDDSTQTSEEAERAAEKRPAPVAAPEPKFNVTQWDKSWKGIVARKDERQCLSSLAYVRFFR